MISSSCDFSVTLPKLSFVRRFPPSVLLTYRSFVHNPPIFSVAATIGVNPKKFECRTKTSTAEMATNKGKGEVKLFNSEEYLAVSLAKYIADLSDKFAKERGAFSIVFSGGSLFNSLSILVKPPYINSVDWSKWHVFWVDERVVPKDHPDSNYLLAYDNFLSKVPILPGNVYAINDALSAEGAADDYETCLGHFGPRLSQRITS